MTDQTTQPQQSSSKSNLDKTANQTALTREPIAIIGAGCRFPGGVLNLDTFWKLLRDEVDAITEIPKERFDIDELYDPTPGKRGKIAIKDGGFLEDIDKFDPLLFGISPREANYLDPQQRLLLEVAWEALEDGGIMIKNVVGSQTAVFIGQWLNDFETLLLENTDQSDFYMTTGSGRYASSGRISYTFGFQGPSLTLDTACSSSLVAIHLACQSLWQGESEMALAGAANTILQPYISIAYSQSNMMAPDGRCKFGDSRANGYVRSEGAAMIVLKPLSKAIADNDRIHALILGSAVNNDGQTSGHLATPAQVGQAELMRLAYASANVSPGQIGYVEAHGTGTRAGDPVEIGALADVLGTGRSDNSPCYVGSVKTNFGHTEGAAGLAGLLKVVLSLKKRTIPASLNIKEPNPAIPWDEIPVRLASEQMAWPDGYETAVAGVSAFGIAGTNAHIVLAEAPLPDAVPERKKKNAYLLPLSAQSKEGVQDLAKHYHTLLTQQPNLKLADIAYTATVRRPHHDERLTLVAADHEQLLENLADFIEGEQPAFSNQARTHYEQPKVAFIFPGQGSQWLGMGRELMAQEPLFQQTMNDCDTAISQFTDWSMLEQLALEPDNPNYRLDQIDVIQPTLLSVEIALAELWRSWGVAPDAVIGHSMGEVGAAYIAGALTLPEAMSIICYRSQLMRRTSGQGAMAVAELTIAEAESAIQGQEDNLSIAVSNSPRSTVVSGDPTALDDLMAKLEADDVFCRRVKVDVASHSPQMEPLMLELRGLLATLQPQSTEVPIYSTSQAAVVDGADMNPDFWASNLRQPVRFSQMVQQLLTDGVTVFIEMSPHPILLTAVQQSFQAATDGITIPSLRRNEPEEASILGSLGTVFNLGYPIDWQTMYPSGQVVHVPTYPFQRERFWPFDSEPNFKKGSQWQANKETHPLLGWKLNTAVSTQLLWEMTANQGTHPYLFEHKLDGHPVLAASAYVEIALAAATSALGKRPFSLKNIIFQQPCMLPQDGSDVRLQISLTTSGATQQIAIHSRQHEIWVHHISAEVVPTNANHTGKFDLATWPQRKSSGTSGSDFYAQITNQDIQIEENLLGVSEVWQQPSALLAQLQPISVSKGESFHVNPALLDACFQLTAVVGQTDSNSRYLPFRLDEIVVSDQGKGVFCHIEETKTEANGEKTQTLQLLDETGQIVIQLSGLHLKQLGQQTAVSTNVQDWLYELSWQPQDETPIPEAEKPGTWIIFTDKSGAGEAIAAEFKKQGHQVVRVNKGEHYSAVSEHQFTLPINDATAYSTLLTTVEDGNSTLTGILHFWSLDSAATAVTTENENLNSALYLVQAIGHIDWTKRPRLWLVTQDAQSHTQPAVAQSPLWGLGRVIAAEQPEIWGGLFDLNSQDTTIDQAKTFVSALTQVENEDQLAIRSGQLYKARFTALARPETKQPSTLPPWRSDSSYLITGGLGDVGFAVATDLVKQGVRRLVLFGRTPLPPRNQWHKHPASAGIATRIQRIRELEMMGTAVHYIPIDVADKSQLQTFFAQYQREGWPSIRGVIHAAAVIDDQLLQNLNTEALHRVLQPKMMGAWLLHELLDDLDVFILFSSIGSVWGQVGQGSYAAANAFLDSLAHLRQSQGLPALSVNWGVWSGLGFAATTGGQQTAKELEKQGIYSFAPAQGLEAMNLLLARGTAQAAVLPVNWPQFQQTATGQKRPFLAEFLQTDTQATESETPTDQSETTIYDLMLASEPMHRQAMMESYLQKQASHILKLSASRIDTDRPLGTMGFDSLMTLEFRNRLENELGVTLSATLVWNYPTIQEMAPYLAEKMDVPLTETAVTQPKEEAEITEQEEVEDTDSMVADIEALSDDDALKSLLGM